MQSYGIPRNAAYRIAQSARQAATSILALVFIMVLTITFPQVAFAEDIDTDPQPDALQQIIERTAADYEAAQAEVVAAEEAIRTNSARIVELELLIPAQQARSDRAARDLYKLGNQSLGILEFLLGSESFYGFMTNLEYVTRVSDANLAEIQRLSEMQSELQTAQADLEGWLADAQSSSNQAESALVAAQEARLEAQRKAQEAARQEEEAAAAAKAASSKESKDEAADEAGDDSAADEADDADDTSDDAASSAVESPSASDGPAEDGADWATDEETFIAEWAPRIDAYLAGSPLAGQGRTFAQAAWAYGVDPRWSPAISYTESSKGEYCFLDYNAWGWGSVSWDSWEEAIDDHVRGLARGYGYTISVDAAKKYCPPNWQHWYDVTSAQMDAI